MRDLSNTSIHYKILGYGICGANEKYVENTLKQFKKLCDHAVILCNNTDQKTKNLILSYGFDVKDDNREWGLNQHLIKEDFVSSLARYKPEWLICLDMDEVFDESFTRGKFEEYTKTCDSMYVFVSNLWNEGWKRQWSFWNIRAWKWNGITKFVNRPLHCGLAPEWAYHYGSYVPVILWHSGLKDKEDRDRKIERYKKYDPESKYRDKSYYDALQDNTSEPIDIEYIQNSLIKEVGIQKRRTVAIDKPKKLYFVRRFSNGVDLDLIEIPERNLIETLKRHPEWVVEGDTGSSDKQISLLCPICGIVSDTPELSMRHKQIHND